LKDAPDFNAFPLLFITLLLFCSVFLVSCFADNAPSISNTQISAITPVGAQATCLTVNSPSLLKLTDGHFQMLDVIDNCGGKNAGPLQLTTQIDVGTVQQSASLIGPAFIRANSKATYHTYVGQTGGTNKEIAFSSPSSPSIDVTILVTINGTLQGEWDGQVDIPAK
jgi:hypothetical protein